jgi:hypothetical protein
MQGDGMVDLGKEAVKLGYDAFLFLEGWEGDVGCLYQ